MHVCRDVSVDRVRARSTVNSLQSKVAPGECQAAFLRPRHLLRMHALHAEGHVSL